MLRELELLPVYDSEYCDLIRDLQVPLLSHSQDYLRGVGFFTSGWLRLAGQGMSVFVKGGGFARIVMSPILDEADWEALKVGEAARFDAALRELERARAQEKLYDVGLIDLARTQHADVARTPQPGSLAHYVVPATPAIGAYIHIVLGDIIACANQRRPRMPMPKPSTPPVIKVIDALKRTR